jgi:sulfur carrier protein
MNETPVLAQATGAATFTKVMHVTVNGERRTLGESASIAALIDEMGFDRKRIAVEVNREVVPLSRHAETRLREGDAVEIVRLVGGG